MKLLDRDSWNEALETLGRNRRRSVITAFGVFWGIFMLIILLALSNGFRSGIDKNTRFIAANTTNAWSQNTTKPFAGFKEGRSWEILASDMDQLRARIPEIEVAAGSATVWSWQSKNLSAGDKSTSGSIVGVMPGYFDALRVTLVHGRMLSEADHREARKYCLLGDRSARELFGEDTSAALGKVIKAGRTYYTVVGVVSRIGNMMSIGSSPSTSVYLPYGVVSITENRHGVLDFVCLVLHPDADNKDVQRRVREYFSTKNQLAPDDPSAVSFFDFSEIFGLFRGINLGIDILVWIVGIGTLLTGVVGISNILLVSIRERTQEIGVRRALGARPSDIIGQLLMESLSLTTLSGLLGIVAGVGVVSMMSNMSFGEDVPFDTPSIHLSIVLVALGVIILSGLLAGVIPAIKATEVRAIEAIREE